MNWTKWLHWLVRGKGVLKWCIFGLLGIFIIWNGVAWRYGGGVITLSILLNRLDIANFLYRHTSLGPFTTMFVGLLLLLVSFYMIMNKAVQTVSGEHLSTLPVQALNKQKLSDGPKIVAIGGGTGLSNLLGTLKPFTANITAIVAVTDDGGSSGRLRRDLGILPPGDIRNCLVALSESGEDLEKMLTYKFPEDSDLAGHNLGNLLMAGLVGSGDCDFACAVDKLANLLAIRGRVLPSTIDDVSIAGIMADGTIIRGETDMVADKREITKVFLTPDDCAPLPLALKAIEEADFIFVGPGSLYTSLITNLLVPGIVDAIKASAARVYYIANVVTQPGEMERIRASQYIETISRHIGSNIFTDVIANNCEYRPEQNKFLSDNNRRPVMCDGKQLKKMGLNVHCTDLIHETDLFRHDAEKLRKLLGEELTRHTI